jgi:hypothetical protein
MSSSIGANNHSRKRPIDIPGGDSNNARNIDTRSCATQAQDYKRRQILQKSWGFREVLSECGLLEFAAVDGDDSSSNNDYGESKFIDVGETLLSKNKIEK